MSSSTDLAALLCSRLCHDLLNPVGSIGNGIELLADEDDPEMRANCMGLLEQSARTSAVKLQFFRFAYGSPGSMGDMVPSGEPRALLEALVADHGRVELQWAVEASELDRTAMKVLLNLAAMGMTALVRGGTLIVGAEVREDATEIAVHASGQRVIFDPAIARALEGDLEAGEMTAHTAPATLVRTLILERGGAVQHMATGDALVLGAALPARTAVA